MTQTSPPEEESAGEKLVQADEAPPTSQAWYTSPQVLAAVAAIGGGVITFCSAFHIVIPYSAIEVTAGLGATMAILGGSFALYRRIKAGLSPKNDAPKINLF